MPAMVSQDGQGMQGTAAAGLASLPGVASPLSGVVVAAAGLLPFGLGKTPAK